MPAVFKSRPLLRYPPARSMNNMIASDSKSAEFTSSTGSSAKRRSSSSSCSSSFPLFLLLVFFFGHWHILGYAELRSNKAYDRWLMQAKHTQNSKLRCKQLLLEPVDFLVVRRPWMDSV